MMNRNNHKQNQLTVRLTDQYSGDALIARVTVAVLTRSPFADCFIDALAADAVTAAMDTSVEYPDALVQVRVANRAFVEIKRGHVISLRDWSTFFDTSPIPTRYEMACAHIVAVAGRYLCAERHGALLSRSGRETDTSI